MDQVSRPFQIALVAVFAFLGLWFVALRPKAEEPGSAAPTPAAQVQPAGNAQTGGAKAESQIGKVAEGVRESTAASSAAEQARAGASDPAEANAGSPPADSAALNAQAPSSVTGGAASATATSSGQGAAAAPKVKRSDVDTLPGPVAAAVGKKVVVLVFYNRRSVDDRAVRRAALGSGRRGGKVAVLTAPIAKLSRFTAITRAVPVLGSPTVVVIDRKLNARAIGGYIDREGVNELIADALRA